MDFCLGYFEPSETFTLTEASGEVDGQHVIGVFEGQFFVPEGTSRNQRFYSKSLWEKCLARQDVQSMLKERRMFGTISHEQPIDDKALMEGKVSHIITELAIKGNIGYGKALILATPVGKFLKTYLGAKAKLYTSSRAYGKFKGENKGVPAVDEDSYVLKGFDIVMDPGFLEANPTLKECYESLNVSKLNQEIPPKGDFKMDEKLFESVVKERTRLEGAVTTLTSELSEAAKTSEKFKNENVVLLDENASMKEKVKDLERQMKLLKEYKDMGTPREVKEALEKFEKMIDTCGSQTKIVEALKRAEKVANENLAIKKDFGTAEEIKQAFEVSERIIAKYQALGTLAEVEKLATISEKRESEVAAAKLAERVKTLSEELGIKPEKVSAVIGHFKSDKAVKEFFAGISEGAKNRETWTKTEEDKKTPAPKEGTRTKLFEGSRASRLINSFK